MKNFISLLLLIITFIIIAYALLAAGASQWLISMVAIIMFIAYRNIVSNEGENEK